MPDKPDETGTKETQEPKPVETGTQEPSGPKPDEAGKQEGADDSASSRRKFGERLQWIYSNFPLLAAVGASIIIFLMMASIFWPFVWHSGNPETTLLRELSKVEVARGLITFLVAVSTVGIALVLIVYAVTAPETVTNEAEKRFSMAKEVLTILIGVLGTIVGFYFGSTMKQPEMPTQTQSQQQMLPLKLENFKVIPSDVKVGDKFKIAAEISGGKPPYDYSVVFTPPLIQPLNRQSGDGKISEEIAVQSISPGTTLEVAFKAVDSVKQSFDPGKPLKLNVVP